MRIRLSIPAAALMLIATILLAACGNDEDGSTEPGSGSGDDSGLVVELDAASFPPGATIAATVINNTDEDFTYGAPYALEREIDGQFEPVDIGNLAFIEIAYVAKAGGKGPAVAVEVPEDAEPGTWRMLLSPDASGATELTAEFEVGDG